MEETKETIIQTIQYLKSNLAAEFGVAKLSLFGSLLHDRANEGSDIDLLVIFLGGKKTFDNFMVLHIYLEDLFW